jgi:hypothetical protein
MYMLTAQEMKMVFIPLAGARNVSDAYGIAIPENEFVLKSGTVGNYRES